MYFKDIRLERPGSERASYKLTQLIALLRAIEDVQEQCTLPPPTTPSGIRWHFVSSLIDMAAEMAEEIDDLLNGDGKGRAAVSRADGVVA